MLFKNIGSFFLDKERMYHGVILVKTEWLLSIRNDNYATLEVVFELCLNGNIDARDKTIPINTGGDRQYFSQYTH